MRLRILLLLASAMFAASPSAAQSPPAPRAVVEALFAAFNRHDLDAMVALYADNVRLTSSDFCAPRAGHVGVRRTYSQLFQAFPDITDTIDQLVIEGDRVAIQFTARSRASGRELNLRIATFITVRGGLIQSDDSIFDTRGQPCGD